jgi:cysteine synthase A
MNEFNIGNTPLVRLESIEKAYNLKSQIYAKLENKNPAGSIKDRVALKMIQDYEAQGKINKDTLIIEATSGNTGIGLAYVCKQRGYKCVIVMPSSMSRERIELIQSYGATVILTDGAQGMTGSINKANELREQNPNSIIASQFENPSNPRAHYESTGPEIFSALPDINTFVCAIGTGGTITGTGKYLKEQSPKIKIVGIEPSASAVLSGGVAGAHKIQGIGAGFIPKVLDTKIYDQIITVSDDEAYKMTREVYENEGIMVGISSGSALFGAIEIAKQNENEKIVVIFPDDGTRYLSLGLFD